MGLLLNFLLSAGVPQRFARAASTALLALLVLGVLAGAKCAYDASVIAEHEAKRERKVVRTERKAVRAADRKDQAVKAGNEAEAAKLEKAISNAIDAHPEEARRSSGPASHAALDQLRRRQHERRP